MTPRELLGKIGFDIEHDKLDKLDKQLEGIKQRLEFLGAVEVLKGLFELTERFSKFAEELHVAAASAGVTVEEFQKLGFAAQQSSVSQEELGMSIARLSRHLFDARRGSAEAQRVFGLAGFTPEQVAGLKNGEDALLALSANFQKMPDPIQKSAIAMEILGRGSVNMVGFLSKGPAAIRAVGGEFERLGVILSRDQVEALVSVEHSLQKVYAVMKAIGATVATYLAPIINTAVGYFLEFYRVNRNLLATNVKGWAEDLAYVLGFVHGVVQTLVTVFLQFAATHPVLVKRIGEVILALITLSSLAWVGKAVFGFLSPLIGILTTVTSLITGVSVEFLLWGAAIGAVVVAAHDLFALFTGRKTWIEGVYDLLKPLGLVRDVLASIASFASGGLIGPLGKLIALVTRGADTAEAANVGPPAPSTTSTTIGGSASSTSNVTVNIAAGAAVAGSATLSFARMIGEEVAAAIDRVHREAARSIATPAQAR
jgi:hypothetical protein